MYEKKLCIERVYFSVHEKLARWVEFCIMHGNISVCESSKVTPFDVAEGCYYAKSDD